MQSKNISSAAEPKNSPIFCTPTLPRQGRKWFSCVPVQIMLDTRVNTTGMKVFMALALHADKETGLVGQFKNGRYYTPGYNRIGLFAGIKRRSVINGVKNLVSSGWIGLKIRRYDNTSVLYLAMPDDLDLAESDSKFKIINLLLSEQDIRANEEVLKSKLNKKPLVELMVEEDEIGNSKQIEGNKAIAIKNIARPVITYQDAVFDIFSFSQTQERQYDDDKIENLGLTYDMDLEELKKEFPQIASKFF